ncbi:MAG TPA: histidine--tRNA ligase [Pyrinomonadaceae bacterium]
MRDLLPQEMVLRNHVTKTILEIYNQYGFMQIETPCAEKINFLSSGEGGENEKMLFKILKRGEKLNFSTTTKEIDVVDLGLRYDLTVPLSRYYASNHAKLPKNIKVIQIGNVWRAERPQKGRYRQFVQCDIDIIGSSNVIAEVELILATSEALRNLDFRNFRVRINDRRILVCLARYCDFEENTFDKVFIILDKLDKISIGGVREELEKSNFPTVSVDKFISIITLVLEKKLILDSLLKFLPNVPESVLEDLRFVINTVQQQAENEYSIEFDLSLVRGMGYYTGQIFEIEVAGYKYSIAGGGRYDKMIGKFLQGKEDIPACGFSIGFERVVSILKEQNFIVPQSKKKIALLYNENLTSFNHILSLARELREKGNFVSLEVLKKKNTKKQIDALSEYGYTSFAIFQNNEPLIIKEINTSKNHTE